MFNAGRDNVTSSVVECRHEASSCIDAAKIVKPNEHVHIIQYILQPCLLPRVHLPCLQGICLLCRRRIGDRRGRIFFGVGTQDRGGYGGKLEHHIRRQGLCIYVSSFTMLQNTSIISSLHELQRYTINLGSAHWSCATELLWPWLGALTSAVPTSFIEVISPLKPLKKFL